MKHKAVKSFFLGLSWILIMSLFLLAAPLHIFAEAKDQRKIVNVVFVIDNTGSMSDEINNVKNNLTTFVSYLKEREGLDELRIGLVHFGDYAIGEKTEVHKNKAGSPWFEDVDELKTQIGNISLGDGGDIDETPFDGLGYLVCGSGYDDYLPFNSDAYKFAFLLTDAGYKTSNRFGIRDMTDLVGRLQKAGIYTSVVTSSSLATTYRNLYNYAPDGAVLDEDGRPFTGEWMNINGDFSVNMRQFADRILDVVRPELEEITLEVGAKFNFYSFAAAHLAKPENATYSTSDDGIVSLSELNPNIGTAMEKGSCVVTITDGSSSVKVQVTVTEKGGIVVPVKELFISTEVVVGVDQSIYIKAVALPEEATEKGLIWRVDDDSIIQIVSSDQNRCYLKGIRSGTAKLTALTVDGGYSGTAMITVTVDPIVPVTGVDLSMTSCTLGIGETATATGTVLPTTATNSGGYWYSNDSSVVSILSSDDSSCTFEAVSCGEAKIYFVSDEGGFSKAIEVTVPHTAKWSVLSPASCTKAGEKGLICDFCHDILDTEDIPATGHTMGPWEPVLPAEGSALKQKKRVCTVCGENEQTADLGASFYTTKAKGEFGSTFEMEVCLRSGSLLSDFQLTFLYNSEFFEIQEVTFSDELSGLIKQANVDSVNKKISVIYSGTEVFTEDIMVFKISFTLKNRLSYRVESLLSLDETAHNVCHTILEGKTYTIDCYFEPSFGDVSIHGPDPNGDGELNIHDLYEMLLVLTGSDYDPYDPALLERMDCNGDGVFDVADITYLQYVMLYMDTD